MASKKKAPSFEEGLERLENIAEQMERGELPLDEVLKLYEEGIKLSGELNLKLEAAGAKMMEVRSGHDGEPVVQPSEVAQQQSMLEGFMEE